jgi:hypothetical protein
MFLSSRNAAFVSCRCRFSIMRVTNHMVVYDCVLRLRCVGATTRYELRQVIMGCVWRGVSVS